MTRLFATSIALAFMTPTVAFGWGLTGHRVVGHLADERLDPAVQAKVKDLLDSETLAMVANWADYIRTDPRYHKGSWHYISIPDGEAYADKDRAGPEGKENIVQAILLNVEILRDAERPKAERAIALKWIAHLVGDLHQPLHVGRAEDYGGNKIKCRWSAEFGGSPTVRGGEGLDAKIDALLERVEALKSDATPQGTADALAEAVELLKASQEREVVSTANLHEIWDTFLIGMRGLGYQEYSRFLVIRRGKTEEAGWAEFKTDGIKQAVEAWTQESLEARKQAYRSPKDHKYGHYNYRDENLPLLEQRLHQAGVRLARLLNVALAD